MTDAWDGRPQNPERDGWHWLEDVEGLVATHPRQWSARFKDWCGMSREEAAEWYRYLGPCLTPAEVAAAVAQARREAAEEAAQIVTERRALGPQGLAAAIRALAERAP